MENTIANNSEMREHFIKLYESTPAEQIPELLRKFGVRDVRKSLVPDHPGCAFHFIRFGNTIDVA